MKIELRTISIWLEIIHAMDMILTSRELTLKLAFPKKQGKFLKTAFCGKENKYMKNILIS